MTLPGSTAASSGDLVDPDGNTVRLVS
jgi:hypothetical protein